MAIQYNKQMQEMDIECDTCGQSDRFDGTYQDCTFEAKMNGWKISKGDEMTHTCADCYAERGDW